MAGVTATEGGAWRWECPNCGEASREYDGRNLARESYKIHRKEICEGVPPEKEVQDEGGPQKECWTRSSWCRF